MAGFRAAFWAKCRRVTDKLLVACAGSGARKLCRKTPATSPVPPVQDTEVAAGSDASGNAVESTSNSHNIVAIADEPSAARREAVAKTLQESFPGSGMFAIGSTPESILLSSSCSLGSLGSTVIHPPRPRAPIPWSDSDSDDDYDGYDDTDWTSLSSGEILGDGASREELTASRAKNLAAGTSEGAKAPIGLLSALLREERSNPIHTRMHRRHYAEPIVERPYAALRPFSSDLPLPSNDNSVHLFGAWKAQFGSRAIDADQRSAADYGHRDEGGQADFSLDWGRVLRDMTEAHPVW